MFLTDIAAVVAIHAALCSLQRESWKTVLDGGQVWMQDAGDLSVSFDLLGFYLQSITSSLR